MQGNALVTFDGVIKRFGSFVAVQKLDLEIHKGEFLAIMGSSGCGKTTTLRMLAGLEAPCEGEIRLGGNPINDLPTWKRDTPMVWQSLALFPFLNVIENVEFALKMRGIGATERRKRAGNWLERMQISEFAERAISQLSGGQRQRVALARSLVVEPEILLLDEPLSALDAHLKVRMQSVLQNLQRELGITFVYVTHSQSEAFAMADRVVIMSKGVVEQVGSAQEIYRAPRTRFVAEFLGSSNIFSGTVMPTGILDTVTGQHRLPHDGSGSGPKSPATLVVLDTRSYLSAVEPGPEFDWVRAKVVGEEFTGAMAKIYLETADGSELRVQSGYDELADMTLETGQELFVYWRPEDGHVLPKA
ncbi:ATP-binding cassette domain-containing protein [Mesorhizobium sp. NBSH29]|uniref:ABC transporter ATP-binding protein n=1 Tax=Mesorhizobium sp. NBSH29 TaxID=2654249 RepID=UPI0018966F84|nr:ABC transporter ATP-binding protein [Mesorhizobium sp. NBSH29]QPC85762.1 ATP-binding cassette domain-containing protein [Mesorhizobium sp. NBSH29]